MEKQSISEMLQDLARQSPPLRECDLAFAPAVAQGLIWGMRWTPSQEKKPGKRARSGLTLHEGIFRGELLALGLSVQHMGPPSLKKLDDAELLRQYVEWRQEFLAGRERVLGKALTDAEKQELERRLTEEKDEDELRLITETLENERRRIIEELLQERRRIIYTAIQRFCIPWRDELLSNKWLRFLPPSSKKREAKTWEKMVPHAARMPGLAVRWFRSIEKEVSDGLDPADAIPAALYSENPAFRKGKDGRGEIHWSKIIGDSINKFMRDREEPTVDLNAAPEVAATNAEEALLDALFAADDADLRLKTLKKIEDWDAKGKAYKAERLHRTARMSGDRSDPNGRPELAKSHGTTEGAMIRAGKKWKGFVEDLRSVS